MDKLHWRRLDLEGDDIQTLLMPNHCLGCESDPSSRSGYERIVPFLLEPPLITFLVGFVDLTLFLAVHLLGFDA